MAQRTRPKTGATRPATGAVLWYLLLNPALPSTWTLAISLRRTLQALSEAARMMDGSVFVATVATGESVRVTKSRPSWRAPTHYCCAFSPDGKRIAYTCPVGEGGDRFDQAFVVRAP